jgi:hypothetical protein
VNMPFQSFKRTVRIPLCGGVVVRVGEGLDGRWRWVAWYRWDRLGGIPARSAMDPPPDPYRHQGFETRGEAAAFFRGLLHADKAACA